MKAFLFGKEPYHFEKNNNNKNDYKTMKVCKFEKIKDENEIKEVANCIQKEHPYAVVLPALTQLQEYLQRISISWFQDEDETSHSAISAISEYCYALTSHLITNALFNQEIKAIIQKCIENIHRLVENKADLLVDRIIKVEVYRLSASLMMYYLREKGLNAKILDTGEFMQLNLERKPDIPYIQEEVKRYLDENRDADLFIIPLSLCKNIYGETDFMSETRNDYYATALATILEADEIVLWTESNHIHASQNSSREQHSLTYEEAENLVNSGINLLYADCITLAARSNLIIRLMDTRYLEIERLYISVNDTNSGIKAILTQDSVAFVRFKSLNVLPGYLLMGKLLEIIGKYKINISSMASSNVSISMILTASNDTLRIIQRELHRYAEMAYEEHMTVIHIIGSLHWERKQIESDIMESIKKVPISFISYGSSDHCFTLSVHTTDKNRLVNSLSQQFLEK